MRIAICDDDRADLDLLREFSETYDERNTTDAFPSGAALREAFAKEPYDLIFLDIEMAPPNGMTLGAELVKADPRPVIFFTTWHRQYAIDGYGIALRYLVKPITGETFSRAMRLAEETILPRKIRVYSDGVSLLLPVAEILWFEVIRNHTILHMKDGRAVTTRTTLQEIREQMPGNAFVQCHKSYCVNLSCVEHISRTNVTITDNVKIPIGRAYAEEFSRKLGKHLEGNSVL